MVVTDDDDVVVVTDDDDAVVVVTDDAVVAAAEDEANTSMVELASPSAVHAADAVVPAVGGVPLRSPEPVRPAFLRALVDNEPLPPVTVHEGHLHNVVDAGSIPAADSPSALRFHPRHHSYTRTAEGRAPHTSGLSEVATHDASHAVEVHAAPARAVASWIVGIVNERGSGVARDPTAGRVHERGQRADRLGREHGDGGAGRQGVLEQRWQPCRPLRPHRVPRARAWPAHRYGCAGVLNRGDEAVRMQSVSSMPWVRTVAAVAARSQAARPHPARCPCAHITCARACYAQNTVDRVVGADEPVASLRATWHAHADGASSSPAAVTVTRRLSLRARPSA